MRRIIVAQELNDIQSVNSLSINRLNRCDDKIIDADRMNYNAAARMQHESALARARLAPVMEVD